MDSHPVNRCQQFHAIGSFEAGYERTYAFQPCSRLFVFTQESVSLRDGSLYQIGLHIWLLTIAVAANEVAFDALQDVLRF